MTWLITLPPEGAARAVGEQLLPELDKALGRERLVVFDCRKYLTAYRALLASPEDNLVADLLNQSLLVQCVEHSVTHFLALPLSPVTLFALNQIKKLKIFNIHWFYEDYRRAPYWKDVLSGYHLMLSIQNGPIRDECRRHGIPHHYLPTASGLKLGLNNLSRKPTVDIVFVGVPSPYRAGVLEGLDRAGFSLRIGGSGWEAYRGPLKKSITAGWISGDQVCQFYLSGKIGLHLSYADPGSRREDTHVSPRVFEILHAGLALVAEDVPLLRETLEGIPFSAFQNEEELSAIIRRELAAHSQNEAAGIQKTIAEKHTYARRAHSIIELVKTHYSRVSSS